MILLKNSIRFRKSLLTTQWVRLYSHSLCGERNLVDKLVEKHIPDVSYLTGDSKISRSSNYLHGTKNLNFAAATGRSFCSDPSHEDGNTKSHSSTGHRTHILDIALSHVSRLGWTEAALLEAAQELNLSPSVIGIFQRGEAELVEYFMDSCLKKLQEELERKEGELSTLSIQERIVFSIRERLEIQALFTSTWAQALSVQAKPSNLQFTLKKRAELLEVLWKASGDQGVEIELFAKKGFLASVYGATELYMLTDYSAGYSDTWNFLKRQVDNVVELNKATQQASFVAKSIGSGVFKAMDVLLKGNKQSPF